MLPHIDPLAALVPPAGQASFQHKPYPFVAIAPGQPSVPFSALDASMHQGCTDSAPSRRINSPSADYW